MVAAIAMKHDKDPRQVIYDKLGDVKDVEVFNDRLLLAIYERPKETAKGIIVPETTRKEDQYQGKICLVVKVGPMVNLGKTVGTEKLKTELRGGAFEVGDWVAVRPSDGWQVTINGQLCKLIEEAQIHMRVPDSDIVW